MSWVAFSYALPSKSPSSLRVALWRRLRRMGAISPTGGVYILPAKDESVEAFQWLVREVQHGKGEALVIRVEQFEGMEDPHLIERFREACAEGYREIDTQAAELDWSLRARMKAADRSRIQDTLNKLRKRHAAIAHVDFIDAPEGASGRKRMGGKDKALY